jgi:HSP20 family protein
MLARIRNNDPFLPLLNDFFGGSLLDSEWTTSPAVNIAENKDEYRIEVAAPGLSKEDFRIHVDNGLLEIAVEKDASGKTQETDETFHRREFCYGNFKRTFTLPEAVEADQISAAFTDGILKITIPKKEEAKEKPAKVIPIQ